MSQQQRIRYLNEFQFYRAMQESNRLWMQAGNKAMTTSQARHLHDLFVQALSERDTDVSRAGKSNMYVALNKAFGDLLPEEVKKLRPVAKEGKTINAWDWYEEGTKDFKWHTGLQSEQPTRSRMLPVSPFDSEYSHRRVMLENGGELLYTPMQPVKWQDSMGYHGIFNEAGELLNLPGHEVMLYRKGDKYHQVGVLERYDDLSGIGALAPYMTKEEYADVRDWVNRVGKTNISRFMSQGAIRRSADVLQALQNDGLSYTVHKDLQHEGQIYAQIDNTKIRVRLTDVRENEHYVGSVYDDGYRYRYSTTKRDSMSRRLAYENPSAQDILRLVRYAMGEDVERQDTNTKVGVLSHVLRGSTVHREVFYSEEAKRPFTATVGTYPGDARSHVRIRMENNRENQGSFRTSEQAQVFLEDAIRTARDNFRSRMDIDRLVDEVKLYQADELYVPTFDGDNGVAAIQEAYWRVLTGQDAEILRPGKGVEEYEESLGLLDGADGSEDPDIQRLLTALFNQESLSDEIRRDFLYDGSPEEKVRQHIEDNVDALIGSYEVDTNGKSFDPILVSRFMTSNYREFRNNDDIVAALYLLDRDADELKGNDFYNQVLKDRLIRFDESSARIMSQHENDFIREMGEEIRQTLLCTGCSVEPRDIRIDEHGVVQYQAVRMFGEKVDKSKHQERAFTGVIGQIFAPSENGAVYTQYAGSDNYMFVPGYEAYVLPQKVGENLSYVERTRVRGYDQMMRQQIRYQVRSDVLASYESVGMTTSVNGVYRRLYDNRHDIDFMQSSLEQGMTESLRDAILETEARRVRYLTPYKEESTTNADYVSKIVSGRDNEYALVNDNFGDMYARTGQTNMSIMDEQGDGIFDPIATGTGTNQGVTRYLVEGASVDATGRLRASIEPDDRTPLMKHDAAKYMVYTPFDRQQMTFSNLMKAAAIAPAVKTAHMTFGGWTFDDGYVVSKEFAEKYQVPGSGGVMRELRVGDKLSDMNGNKGVISLIVDRDMSEETAREQDIDQAVAWFKANPSLDVVGAPYTAPSRFNGGTAIEMMQQPSDLVSPDGKVFEGSIGEANFIITHMVVDEKTHIYGEDELAKGKGRKMSAQLAWALNSQGATEVLGEAYSSNGKALSNLREMMITLGYDVNEIGDFKSTYTPQVGEERQIWTLPPAEMLSSAKGDRLDVRGMREKFYQVISQQGGFLEVPFPLTYMSGETLKELNADKTGFVKDGETGSGSYGLPIMSVHLRSGQILDDGISHVHDYTNHYLRIYEAALKYREALKDDPKGVDTLPRMAQSEFNNLGNDLVRRKFQGKYNIFRDDLMSNRMPNSITAVWTADPRLDIDQIAMPPHMAASMNVKENDYILNWRDPVLRDAGVRYSRVAVREGLTGIAINPAMDKNYDGDFDGDALGGAKLHSKAAHRDALDKLSVGANLLDYGVVNKDGSYPLLIQNSLDLKSVAYQNPDFATQMHAYEVEANEALSLTGKEKWRAQQSLIAKLSKTIQEGFKQAYGTDVISYKDVESHLRSVEPMIQSGAKGSYSKLQSYGKYLGAEFDLKQENGKETIDYSTLKVQNKPIAGREEAMAVQYATAVKSFGTGVAGKFSQRGIRTLRNVCPKAVLELTYPVTQAILQSKHDPIEARHKYENLMGPARALWQGLPIVELRGDDGELVWRKEKIDKDFPGMPKDEWAQRFVDFYESKSGLNVSINPAYVQEVADALADKNGLIRNLEEDLSMASPMDRMAYDGNFNDLKELVKQGANVFDGKYNQYFMPKGVRLNFEALSSEDFELEDLRTTVSKDTQADFKPKRMQKQAVTSERAMPENLPEEKPKPNGSDNPRYN